LVSANLINQKDSKWYHVNFGFSKPEKGIFRGKMYGISTNLSCFLTALRQKG